MTPEEFEALLKPGTRLDFMFTTEDGMRLANAVAGLDESQRRKLSKTASQFYQRARKQPNAIREQEFGALAVLAVCPLSEARKVDATRIQRHEATVVKVLVDRRPEWLTAWLEEKLAQEFPRISWRFLRAVLKQGACAKPTSDGYVQLLAASVGFPIGKDGSPKRSEQLLAEPDLLEDVWRLFEVETLAFQTFHYGPNYPGYEDWPATLLALSRSEHLDRDRLLDACLRAIGTEFANHVLTGFINLHERLEFSPEEIVARQRSYRDLLASRKSHVVTFALEVLAGLEKGGRLDGEGFLNNATSVFGLKPKSQPKAVLSLAGKLVKRQPELVPQAVELATEALTHESVDVQEQAAGLLEAWLPRMHRDHATEIRERASGVAATVRGRIEALLPKLEGESGRVGEWPQGGRESIATVVQPSGETSPQLTPDPFPGDVAERASALPEKWRHLAGVDEAFTAMQEGRLPAPLSFDLLDVPLLTATEPIQPIQTVDELLDAVAHAIEEIESADELERILDGISRLCDQRPDDFDLRAAPLIKRLYSDRIGAPSRGLTAATLALRRLIDGWLTGQPSALSGYGDQRCLTLFITHRLQEIETRVARQQAAPLLAAPTHRGGWIDARILVERLLEQKAGGQPPQADLIQALLRLAPGTRESALAAAAALAGHTGRAVRWALGGQETPTSADFGDFSLWLAAGRARDPVGELVALAPLINDKLVEALLPPTFTCKTGQGTTGHYRPAGAVDLLVEVFPPVEPSLTLQMRPTLALCEPTGYGHHPSVSVLGFQWLAAVWPLNVDPLYADGIHALIGRVNSPPSSFEPNYVFLQPLLEPDRPWTEMGYLMAWIALVSKGADSRGAAVDAFITAIDDGRASASLAAAVLSRLMPAGWVKLNRLADAFREISRVGPLHAWWTTDLLQAFLVETSEWPADIHHALGLVLELRTDLQLAVPPAARDKLDSTKTTGKAAQAIKRLLALKATPASPKTQEALALALDRRLSRAERWASAS